MQFYKAALFCAMFIFCGHTLPAQEGTIVYTYDEGGKMIQRKIQVMQGGRMGKFDNPKDSTRQREFKVFPNPTNQYLSIEGELPENSTSGEILLMNVSGQVMKKDIYSGQPKSLIVSDLKPGLYLLEIKYSKKQKSTYKIIISN